ncbi:Ig-like domain-containing protein [Zhouia sp. PK063]|uniref:Ig-like domain-containing protein n=1 Tax=Zhouia sp. PK063 TaxID=3373602 RepID=UPI0037A21C5C
MKPFSVMLMKAFFLILLCFSSKIINAQNDEVLPFSTDSTHITVWNGEKYVPLFIKGINLGVSVPGTLPGALDASREQYDEWLELIHEAGFNTIRLYTMHYPRFYQALKDYNDAHPQTPIYIFQGVWLEEEIDGYTGDLTQLDEKWTTETHENVDCMHGNAVLGTRFGKAYGTYTADVSKWVLGYIIGREISPDEIHTTNANHTSTTSYSGKYLSIDGVKASEVFLISHLDKLLDYEQTKYNTQRPVSFSSWPTLDPLSHPTETTTQEDQESVDIENLDFSKAKAGVFASYHAYPYYPDFISKQSDYTQYSDYLGQNSYLGYLTDLKNHYKKMPLVIAEFGAPSSWGVAHYANNGINHGGHDENEQGEDFIRLLQNIDESGCAGGMAFSWIDEWFKRTWITDPVDYNQEIRMNWHNVTAAEQNFGLLGFEKDNEVTQAWEHFCDNCKVSDVSAVADYTYFKFNLKTPEGFGVLDTIWVGIDTYDKDLGESILPNGKTVANRAEFALMITNYQAQLYVTQAYDLFALWQGDYYMSDAQQLHSTKTDGAPWRIVRWKNNQKENDVQYIGDMRVNRLDLPETSLDAVRLKGDSIQVRLPWTLLNFVDPTHKQVFNDTREDYVVNNAKTSTTDGIALSIFYNKDFNENTTTRFTWDDWNLPTDAKSYKKNSYKVMKEELPYLPGNPVAYKDEYTVAQNKTSSITASNGLLSNDISLDGTTMEAVINTSPQNGIIQLQSDGSFTYSPVDGFGGPDNFTYRVRAGIHWSEPVTVALTVDGEDTSGGGGNEPPVVDTDREGFFTVYTSQTEENSYILDASAKVDRMEIYAITGQLVSTKIIGKVRDEFSLDGLSPGVYFVKVYSKDQTGVKKILVR